MLVSCPTYATNFASRTAGSSGPKPSCRALVTAAATLRQQRRSHPAREIGRALHEVVVLGVQPPRVAHLRRRGAAPAHVGSSACRRRIRAAAARTSSTRSPARPAARCPTPSGMRRERRRQVGERAALAAAERACTARACSTSSTDCSVSNDAFRSRAVRLRSPPVRSEHARLRDHRVELAHARLERMEQRVDSTSPARAVRDAAVGREAVDAALARSPACARRCRRRRRRCRAPDSLRPASRRLLAEVLAVIAAHQRGELRAARRQRAGGSFHAGQGCAAQFASSAAPGIGVRTPWRLTITTFCTTSSPSAAPPATR